ncbi:LOW QUALITY PROTEIN: ileal sodium/bile acid cotransporter-like [Amphiura filiformis]|uniref:LOW QUALITY PROTEIN: ileal sodium/bile acid cotransporter-like n=1 Tax=Amphiura filiformis TaxID=82378 RepID=UPI003B20EC20
MGATMDWRAIWEKLKKPYGVIIGLLCQFIVMLPALAFSLAKLMSLDNAAALGLIIIGCCPGGWVSNIYSLLLDCDLILSITMTTCSTILALGTMPANLFIYGTPYTTKDNNLAVPYTWTILQILMLIIPILVGMILYYKTPRLAEKLGKFLRLIAIIMILIGLGFGLPANLYAFYVPLNVVFVALLLPIVGSILGLLLAKASCLYNTSAVTVALETGAQNSLIGALVAQFSFPQPEADLIARVPLMVAMFTMGYGALVTLIYVIFKRCPGKIHAPEVDEEACELTVNNTANEATGGRENGDDAVLPARNSTQVDNKIKPMVHENGGFTNDEAQSNVSTSNNQNEVSTRAKAGLNGSNNNSNFETLENTYF